MHFIKIKNLCSSKNIVGKIKGKSQLGRIFFFQIIYPTQCLYAKYIKNTYNSNNEKTRGHHLKKWAKDLRDSSPPKKDESVANKHINGYSTWIVPNHEEISDKPELRGIVQTNLPIIS